MNAVADATFPAGPAAPRDGLPAFAAALAMHAALVAWMWIAVQWHTRPATPAVAELWELAPAEVVVPPAPVEPAPTLSAPPVAKPDIVTRREPTRKPATETPLQNKPHKKNRDERAVKPPPPSPDAEARQREEMARLSGQAGQPGHAATPASQGQISNSYSARIQAAIRSHLFFAVPDGVPPSAFAEFAVELLPTGELAGEPRLVSASGVPGYDEAARRAILRTDPFPRRDDGTVPRSFILRLYPQEAR
jgi:colicin import membrane protein